MHGHETVTADILTTMSTEDLIALKNQIETILSQRASPESPEHRFTFEATNDPRKGVPYVARLTWDVTENKIQRTFVDLQRTYGKKEVTVAGTYSARDGEIIEIRTGGSWKNDYRAWFIVRGGEMVEAANISNAARKMKVEQYLRGEIPGEEL